jgi:hypothetical protein
VIFRDFLTAWRHRRLDADLCSALQSSVTLLDRSAHAALPREPEEKTTSREGRDAKRAKTTFAPTSAV